MWGIVLLVCAILVSAGAALQSIGPSARDGAEVAQAQVVRRLAAEVSSAARVKLTDTPDVDLPSLGLPAQFPDSALYGRRDLALPYSALVPGGHDWLPTARSSAGAALPPISPGAALTDPRAYEVGVFSCKKLTTDAAPGAYSVYAAFCPVTASHAYHLVVVKAGWLGAGNPTQLLSVDEILGVLKKDFGYVQPASLDTWRVNGGLTVDSFVILI